ncbi:MAG: TauD/TfdA family dioxygenase [Burkholderiales bacterium]|nr:TauD/TfdA family dioxygenase [Burkholderiales bacterium]
MALELKPLHPVFAAEASGVDLRRPLDAATIAAIDAAMDRHAVLVFRDQPMSETEQVACARQFGPLDAGLRKATGAATRFAHEELIDISNLALDGSIAARDAARLVGTLANQLWHSDSSFQNLPIKYSMLSAVAVPETGGDTEWADLRAAFDALPDDLRAAVAGRSARHSTFHSRILLGDDKYTREQLERFAPVEWPLVRTHPGSGRQLLFVGAHCDRIDGMSVPEARLLIAELIEHATQRDFVYRHRWRAGDYVMWDNRSTLHRGRRYDLAARRDLRRTTTLERHAA